MKWAIISDVHANLAAFEAVLKAIEKDKPDKILMLGDVVGYGPDPDACVSLAKENVDFSILGNHDAAVSGLMDYSAFNMLAKKAVEWTNDHISEESKSYLSERPLVFEDECFIGVHGTPDAPSKWYYILSKSDALDAFDRFEKEICFIGHSHVPAIFEQDQQGKIDFVGASRMLLSPESRYIVNVGSVGQPRDKDPRAAYTIWDTESRDFQQHRVEYDVIKTQKKMIDAKFPGYLILRLQRGK